MDGCVYTHALDIQQRFAYYLILYERYNLLKESCQYIIHILIYINPFIHSYKYSVGKMLSAGKKRSLRSSPLRSVILLHHISMASRLAACEACRKAKVACDHKRPACTRCASNDRAGICIYRTTPFKRRRAESSTPLQSPR